MRVVLVGGGTGGHFYPLIAIAERLLSTYTVEKTPLQLYYMGPNPYDADALSKLGITFISCPSGKRRRYFSILNFFDTFKILSGIVIAIAKLFILYPDVVMSKGGYTSVPVVLAAGFLRIPVVIHESDAVAGSANKLAAKIARYIAVSYEEAADLFPAGKVALTGIPIRQELLASAPGNPLELLELDTTRPLIMILGGSQGAERVNDLILESLDELLPEYNVLHQTGAQNFEAVCLSAKTLITDPRLLERYHPVPSLTPEVLGIAYQAASIVISRAGSGTIFEIAAHGKPSILIPIPESISHDQRTNAYAYARKGGAVVMEEGNLRDGLLTAEISRIMGDPAVYGAMQTAALGFSITDASEKIASILISIHQEH